MTASDVSGWKPAPKRSVYEVFTVPCKEKDCTSRMLQFYVFFQEKRFRGDWAKTNKSAHFWGFAVANYAVSFWVFFLFVVVKKVFLGLVMELTDGVTNAWLVIFDPLYCVHIVFGPPLPGCW